VVGQRNRRVALDKGLMVSQNRTNNGTLLAWRWMVGYRTDLWELAATHNGVVVVREAEEVGVPAVEVRKLAARGALIAYGQGVYKHREVPATPLTQPTVAVALAGVGAFLHRESVLDLFGLGQFNPPRVRVGTRRRVRRTLPEWMALENRTDVDDEDLTQYEGIPATTVWRALEDMRHRMPPDRWGAMVGQALRRELISEQDVALWEGVPA
jgi:predicted transcriptional regulator of viral defense system